MKEGWKYKKLGDICKIERGGSPRPIKDFITNDENGLNWIKIGDTDPEGKYIYGTKEKIKPEGLKKSRWVEEDDFLLSNSMSFGRPYILKTNGCIHDGWLVLKDYHSVLDKDFLYYMLISPTVQSQFKNNAQGSTVNNLNTDRVAATFVQYPPLSEQQAIVSRLDTAFAKIDAVKANAEKQLSDAKALFQKELSKAMTPKEGWERKKLGEVCASMADGPFGSNLKKEHYTENKEVRIIQLSNIGEDGWREDNTKYTTFEHLETIKRSEVKPGDIVIAKMMPAGRAILCPNHESGYVLSSDAVRATLKKDLDNNFILFSINSEYFRKQVYANVSGSGRVRTSLTKLKECFLYIPPLSEQQAIVSYLDTLSEKLKTVEEKQKAVMAECDAMKQALLREVFE